MVATLQFYNSAANRIQSGLDVAADTYKVALLSAAATFNAGHTTLAQVTDSGADEVLGYGWASGGGVLENVTITVVNTTDSMFDADDISVDISGGDLGPIAAYVIYNDTDADDPPIAFVALDPAITVEDGYTLRIPWSVDGIFRVQQ